MLPEELKEKKIKQQSKTKICPFCKNKIKYEAIKCMYCHETLENKIITGIGKNKNKAKSNNDKSLCKDLPSEMIATKWSRFWAWFTDTFVAFTLIWWIINFFMALISWTTIWLKVAWIRITSLSSNELSFKQKFLRFFSYVPFRYSVIVMIIIPSMIFWIDLTIIQYIIYPIMWILFLVNIVELCNSVPTFIDKWLNIIKVQYKWITTWVIFVIFLVVIFLFRALYSIQWY